MNKKTASLAIVALLLITTLSRLFPNVQPVS